MRIYSIRGGIYGRTQVPAGSDRFHHPLVPPGASHHDLWFARARCGAIAGATNPTCPARSIRPRHVSCHWSGSKLLTFLTADWDEKRRAKEPLAASERATVARVLEMDERYVAASLCGNRFCWYRGGPHKSNNVYLVIDKLQRRYRQKCHDEECRCASPWFGIPGNQFDQEGVFAALDRSAAPRLPAPCVSCAAPLSPPLTAAQDAPPAGVAISQDAADAPDSTAAAPGEQPGALDEFFLYLSRCPPTVLDAARSLAAREMPGLLYVMQTAEDKAEEFRLERAFLDAKKAAAEANAVRAAEQSLRTTQKVGEIMKGHGDFGDRSEHLGVAIEHVRSCTLKVKEAEAALRAAQKRHKANRFAAVSQKAPEGSVLQFFSADIRADRRIVAEAVKTCGGAIQFASDILRDDIDIAVDAVTRDPLAARFLGPTASSDARVARAALGVVLPTAGRRPGPARGSDQHGHSGATLGHANTEPSMTQSLSQALGGVMDDCAGASGAETGAIAATAPPEKRRKARTDGTFAPARPEARCPSAIVVLSQPPARDTPRAYAGQKARQNCKNECMSRLRSVLSATQSVSIKDVFDDLLTEMERQCYGNVSQVCRHLCLQKDVFCVSATSSRDRPETKRVRLVASSAAQPV